MNRATRLIETEVVLLPKERNYGSFFKILGYC